MVVGGGDIGLFMEEQSCLSGFLSKGTPSFLLSEVSSLGDYGQNKKAMVKR